MNLDQAINEQISRFANLPGAERDNAKAAKEQIARTKEALRRGCGNAETVMAVGDQIMVVWRRADESGRKRTVYFPLPDDITIAAEEVGQLRAASGESVSRGDCGKCGNTRFVSVWDENAFQFTADFCECHPARKGAA